MIRFRISPLLFLCAIALCTGSLFAQTPRTISFQGVLSDGSGDAISDGQHEITVIIYNIDQGGQPLFTEKHTTNVQDGLFNIVIGSLVQIPPSMVFNRAYYLGISVDNDPELAPRTPLTAVPYALYTPLAEQAKSLAPNAVGVVTSVNTLQGDVTLRGGGSTTVSQNGNDITISSVGGGGGTGIQGVQNIDGTIAIQNPGGPVATIGLADASVTGAKLQPGAVTLDKISTSGAANGQVPSYNGSTVQWTTPQSGGGGLTLPFKSSVSTASNALDIENTAGKAIVGKTVDGGTAIVGIAKAGSTIIENAGVSGASESGYGVAGTSVTGAGVYGISQQGQAASFKTITGNTSRAVSIQSDGNGEGLNIEANNKGMFVRSSNGIAGHFVTGDAQAAAIVAASAGTGAAVSASSISGPAVIGNSFGAGEGLLGLASSTTTAIRGSNSQSGIAMKAEAVNGRALVASSKNSTAIHAFSENGTNIIEAYGDGGLLGNLRFRVLQNGNVRCDGAFTGGGADVAEAIDFEGRREEYEPGDVLSVSTISDRTIVKCSTPNSTTVIGVYATKPGVLLSTYAAEDDIDHLIPVGVVGIIPTKVCSENGPIRRGDLLVTSSTEGHAMKAIPAVIQGISIYPTGAIIGKAMENYDASAPGKIEVMVNVK